MRDDCSPYTATGSPVPAGDRTAWAPVRWCCPGPGPWPRSARAQPPGGSYGRASRSHVLRSRHAAGTRPRARVRGGESGRVGRRRVLTRRHAAEQHADPGMRGVPAVTRLRREVAAVRGTRRREAAVGGPRPAGLTGSRGGRGPGRGPWPRSARAQPPGGSYERPSRSHVVRSRHAAGTSPRAGVRAANERRRGPPCPYQPLRG
jgi:hypothetical protein